ncbi:hypothetical protein ES332_A07G218700v1 [Gossypium tomentosum]|uniref:Uncharacterized protein n=1 Tax=Gossypium tomentosum TaxID=34277 RepID=A0A5D2PVT7_GOSTO|nr:hypothetical protein ES332_A07G218700v1 [Gossypium tomentosum]
MFSILEEPLSLGISVDSISTKQREEIHGIFSRCVWRGGIVRGAWHEWKNRWLKLLGFLPKIP